MLKDANHLAAEVALVMAISGMVAPEVKPFKFAVNDEPTNRGAYFVEELSHRDSCHTLRTITTQKRQDTDLWQTVADARLPPD